MTIDFKDEVIITSFREKDINWTDICSNGLILYLQNFNEKKLDVYSYDNASRNSSRELNLSCDNFNISIQPEMSIRFGIKNLWEQNFENLKIYESKLNIVDNIININNPNFFKNYSNLSK